MGSSRRMGARSKSLKPRVTNNFLEAPNWQQLSDLFVPLFLGISTGQQDIYWSRTSGPVGISSPSLAAVGWNQPVLRRCWNLLYNLWAQFFGVYLVCDSWSFWRNSNNSEVVLKACHRSAKASCWYSLFRNMPRLCSRLLIVLLCARTLVVLIFVSFVLKVCDALLSLWIHV